MKTKQTQNTQRNAEILLKEVKRNNLLRMITKAEKELNPFNYQLSFETKKRLRWLYILYCEENGNVTKTAKKIGISPPSHFFFDGIGSRELEPWSWKKMVML